MGRVARVLLHLAEVDSQKSMRHCSLRLSVELQLLSPMFPLSDQEKIDHRTLNRRSSEMKEGKVWRKRQSRIGSVGWVM